MIKTFNNDLSVSSISTNEENTNYLKLIQIFLSLDEACEKTVNNEYTQLTINITNTINLPYEMNISEIHNLIKENSSLKAKIKQLITKIEKNTKELKNLSENRKKETEKGNYNLSVKEKLDNKIMKALNEFSENKECYNLSLVDIEKNERYINQFISTQLENSAKFLFAGLNKLRFFFNLYMEGKVTIFFKLIQEIIANSESIIKISHPGETKILEVFCNQKLVLEQIEEHDIETLYSKNNFNTSNLLDSIQVYLNSYLSFVYTRKKITGSLLKFVKEKIKQIESFCSSWLKVTNKNYNNFPKNTLVNCSFIIQINDIIRSTNDLIIKKITSKVESYADFIQLLDTHLKELSNEELQVQNTLSKYNKEMNSIKENINKTFLAVEKVQNSIESIKQEISNSIEDPSFFSKYESKLTYLRKEENENKELYLEAYKKSKKFIEENFSVSKKLVKSGLSLITGKTDLILNNINKIENIRKEQYEEIYNCIEIFKNQFLQKGMNIYEECKKILTSFCEKNYLYSINKEQEESVDKFIDKIFSLSNLSNHKTRQSNLNTNIKPNDKEDNRKTSGNSNLSSQSSNEGTNNDSERKNSESSKETSSEKKIESKENQVTNNNECLILSEQAINFIDEPQIKRNFTISEDIFTSDELKDYQELINKLKTQGADIKISLIEINKSKYEGTFYLESDETVNHIYNCSYEDSILLQGKIYLTNYKLVFYSWFNGSTLFGKTLLELPYSDVIEINKKSYLMIDNGICLKTKKTKLNFHSFGSRNECYDNLCKLIFKSESINCIENSNTESTQKDIKDSLSLKNEENDKNEKNEKSEDVANTISNSKTTRICFSTINLKLSIIDKLKIRTKENLDSFYLQNPRKILEVYQKNVKLGHLPCPYIFHSIYDPNVLNPFFNRYFYQGFKESVKDYNLKYEVDKAMTIPDIYKIKYPILNSEDNEENFNLFERIFSEQYFDENLIVQMLESFQNPDFKSSNLTVVFTSVHPLPNPKFMGPKELTIREEVKLYFISPTCFIADHYSYLSGFMLMDTFYCLTSYRFETDIIDNRKKISFDSKVTVEYTLEFVKSCFWKDKVMKESTNDNREYLKVETLPKIIKGLESTKNRYNENLKIFEDFKKSKQPIEETIEEANNLVNKEIVENEEILQKPEEIEEQSNSANIIDSNTSSNQDAEKSDNLVLTEVFGIEIGIKEIVFISVLLIFLIYILWDYFPLNLQFLNTILLVFIIYKIVAIEQRIANMENDKK